MAPRKTLEFVIVRLTYCPFLNPNYPRISFQIRRFPPNGSIALVRPWFESVMRREGKHLPPGSCVRFCEWRIVTGNLDLFTINSYRYDKIMLLLGETYISWTYYQCLPIHPRIEGCGIFPISYCSCCLENQYLNIMDKIKETVLGYANKMNLT